VNTIACATFQDLLIPPGFALSPVTVIAFVIINVFRSGGSV
jgi:hypothetical protein